MDYRVTHGSTREFADTQDFINSLASNLDQSDHHGFFTENRELIVTRAPGRLDVMGGIADYSGSLVLQLPIADATHVALQKVDSNRIRILSLGSNNERRFAELDLTDLLSSTHQPIEYDEARRKFSNPDNHWVAYTFGLFLVLMCETNFVFPHGVDILIKSDVPEGKGVSSSAAIEVATMQALNVAYDLQIPAAEIALLCQKTENLIAAAPCGIMDQMTSVCGEADRLLELLCQPAKVQGTLALPSELELWGIDSGVRHSVGGSDYGTVRTAAFMGYRIIADITGRPVVTTAHDKVRIEDSRWGGYLANLSVDEFDATYSAKLPESIGGAEFLDRYQGITDHVTSVDADINYPVRVATRHPIYEHARVRQFASILKSWQSLNDGPRLGQLMFQSHQSYSDCALGSEATDLIVELVRALKTEGLFGARITGGGSGGTVAVLGRRGSGAAIKQLQLEFQQQTGYEPLVIAGSSPGASIFGHVKVALTS
jgi:galactokinase